jgi:hypothetical protein
MGFFAMKGPFQISVQKTGMEDSLSGLRWEQIRTVTKSDLVRQVALT